MFNRRRFRLAAAAVVMLAAAVVFHRLGAADVCGANEAVEGVFVQQMVEHGALLFPMLNRREPMYKPPLFHWTATALDRTLGVRKVTALNLRTPSALYAVAGVALTIAFAATILPPSGAILSGLILTGSYQYLSQGRIGRVDMTLTFFETLALFVFLWRFLPPGDRGAEKSPPGRDQWLLYLLALALGLGVLAKGPVGAILPALAIAIFLMIERGHRELAAMLRAGPVLLALAVGSSWYLACFFGNRYGFLHRQLGSENFGRFFGALGMMPPWYYLMPILLNSVPLSLLVPIAVVDAMRSRRSGADPGTGETGAQRARLSVRLLAIFWIVTVAFFTLAAYKRRAYLLPLWPASAVMLAWWTDRLASRRFGRMATPALGAACVAIAAVNFAYLPSHEIKECDGDSMRPAAEEITRVVGPDEPLFIYGVSENLLPLLFYLDRDASELEGKLGDAPPGYVIVPLAQWTAHKGEALGLEPVLIARSGRHILILLRRGKVYAAARPDGAEIFNLERSGAMRHRAGMSHAVLRGMGVAAVIRTGSLGEPSG